MTARGAAAWLGAALALLGAGDASAEERARPRAAGGVRLVEAAESAPATVVGEVGAVRALDRHGRAAPLAVTRVLRGPLPRDETVTIAWEELVPTRAARFAEGERILVSLEALPGHSLWRERLPDPEARTATLHVAMDGGAFLREPRQGTLDTLAHYLWLSRAEREGASGADHLVTLAAEAEPAVAADAVARLAARAELALQLDAEGAGRLGRALAREGASEPFQRALVELLAGHGLEAARPALEALAAGDPPAPPAVYEALARLEGGLSPERSAALLRSAPPAQRRVAARHLTGPGARATLEGVLRRDPAPEVRVAAAERLAEREGAASLEPLLDALADPAGEVRGTAARLLAGLGPEAVAPLRQVALGNDAESASAAVVALGLSPSPDARVVLREIAAAHRETRLGELAELALGGSLGHRD